MLTGIGVLLTGWAGSVKYISLACDAEMSKKFLE
jgi:hypothetical protein